MLKGCCHGWLTVQVQCKHLYQWDSSGTQFEYLSAGSAALALQL
jgi:hypothetical protein